MQSPFDAPVVGLWLGPGAHVVHYPVRGGEALNIVVVTDGTRADIDSSSWNSQGDYGDLLARACGFTKNLRDLLERPEGWRTWSLTRLTPLRNWHTPRMTLLGDAAHPVLPFLAQGAGLAIEDAVALGKCMRDARANPLIAFPRYESLRRARVTEVQRASARLGRLYHLGAPLRFGRNIVLRMQRPLRLLAGFDWLYRDQTSR
jgi:salicylate hydroxylase